MQLTTQRCQLINADESLLSFAVQNEILLAEKLKVKLSRNWNHFGAEIFTYVLDKVKENQESQTWWTWFPIHKDSNTLIGTCGYKGPPNQLGEVEIGYEIAPDFRNRGLATEMAKALVDYASNQIEVEKIIAHTLPMENPSTSVLKKLGFFKVAELIDPEDGAVWRWELRVKIEN